MDEHEREDGVYLTPEVPVASFASLTISYTVRPCIAVDPFHVMATCCTCLSGTGTVQRVLLVLQVIPFLPGLDALLLRNWKSFFLVCLSY